MNVTFYIVTAWVVTIGSVALYSLWLVRKGRDLSTQVPEEHRRWM